MVPRPALPRPGQPAAQGALQIQSARTHRGRAAVVVAAAERSMPGLSTTRLRRTPWVLSIVLATSSSVPEKLPLPTVNVALPLSSVSIVPLPRRVTTVALLPPRSSVPLTVTAPRRARSPVVKLQRAAGLDRRAARVAVTRAVAATVCVGGRVAERERAGGNHQLHVAAQGIADRPAEGGRSAADDQNGIAVGVAVADELVRGDWAAGNQTGKLLVVSVQVQSARRAVAFGIAAEGDGRRGGRALSTPNCSVRPRSPCRPCSWFRR